MILLTGATGFLGRHLLERLLSKEEEVRVLVRKKSLRSLPPSHRMTYAVGDLTDRASLEIALGGVEGVIHAAAVIEAVSPETFDRVNREGTEHLVGACQKVGIRRFLYVSSDAAQKFSLSAYGQSKLAAEAAVKVSGLDWTIFRPAVIYGEGDRRNITTLLDIIRRSPIVPVMGDGRYCFQPVYVGDVAEAIIASLRNEKAHGKTYALASSERISMDELLRILAAAIHRRPLFIHLPLPLVRGVAACIPSGKGFARRLRDFPRETSLDIESSCEELKFSPRPFQEGIKTLLSNGR